ncbi:MAG: O-linked GlcNAc transferase [Gemmatales bacterium]|nr:MAG: O-linked GlcNAc transferase [Gemmatales bacterium]
MGWLQGKQVAFTGRLATMTRAEAIALIESLGGQFSKSVTRQTQVVVVGQEGWPIRIDGGLTRKLEKAQQLQQAGCDIEIVAEQEWLDRLGFGERSQSMRRLYTAAQLGRLLRVPRERLRAWMRAGLIQPAETFQGICYFDFQQINGVKTLCDLTRMGVRPETVRKSLERLTRWLPDIERPLEQLAIIQQNGQLLVRLEEGQLAETNGQLQFDFPDEEESSETVRFETVGDGETDWQSEAEVHAEAGRLVEAARCYRRALLQGEADAETSFCLANVLYELGEKEAARERYYQAVELDGGFAEAWNNLGNVLCELEAFDEAIWAYRQALAAEPLYADAHYNLADTLDQLGRLEQARPHWQAYLAQEKTGRWADYARSRLRAQ